jgi:hypothetical protein
MNIGRDSDLLSKNRQKRIGLFHTAPVIKKMSSTMQTKIRQTKTWKENKLGAVLTDERNHLCVV